MKSRPSVYIKKKKSNAPDLDHDSRRSGKKIKFIWNTKIGEMKYNEEQKEKPKLKKLIKLLLKEKQEEAH